MDLESLYAMVKENISRLDFNRIWPGFSALKFALYDQKKCFFDGRYIEKTSDFCANTSIVYQGEQIAIWMVQEELPPSVLTSKIVHEMFHGYQSIMGWDAWPNELEALNRYEYDAENLSLKLRENELLLSLLVHYDKAGLTEFLGHRKHRSEAFAYAFSYESKVEEIEGTANFVEWQVLKQLDAKKAVELEDRMRTMLRKPECLFPIRISCYFSGALMIHALLHAGIYSFGAKERPVIYSFLQDMAPSDGVYPEREDCLRKTRDAVDAFNGETESIIRTALEQNEAVLRGPLELTGVNVYNARCRRGFITSTYFLMYREGGEDKVLPGNFVIRMRNEKIIDTVYRWN